MGAFFNNLHIRKNETADVGSVKNEFTEYLKSKGYQPTENGDDADDTAYIYTSDNSDWITVFSDVLEIGDEQTFAEILHPFSKSSRVSGNRLFGNSRRTRQRGRTRYSISERHFLIKTKNGHFRKGSVRSLFAPPKKGALFGCLCIATFRKLKSVCFFVTDGEICDLRNSRDSP